MTAYYNEFDPKAAAWLRELISRGLIAPGEVDERSIEDVRPTELMGYTQCHFFAGIGGWSYALRLAGWSDDRPVWTGSCPCQPYSSAGARGGADDPRNLWWAFRWHIDQCRPATVFGEQVAGNDGGEWLAGVREDTQRMGYQFGAANLCASLAGLPQRARLFWMADAHSDRERRSVEHEEVAGIPKTAGRSPWEWCTTRGLVSSGDGLPKRVGLKHGYGNAIVPQVAALFIVASMTPTTPPSTPTAKGEA